MNSECFYVSVNFLYNSELDMMYIGMKALKTCTHTHLQCFDTVGWVAGRASGP